MFSLPGEVLGLLVGVSLVVIRLALTAHRRRWRALAGLSKRRGFAVRRRDSEHLPGRYGQLDLMRYGYNRRVRDVVSSSRGRPGRAFCYHYETGFGKGHASCELTVAVVETEANRPGMWIGAGRGPEAVAAFARYRSVDLLTGQTDVSPDDPAPGARASVAVYAESPRWVEAHLEPDAGSVLGQGSEVCEIRGPWVALYQEGVGSAQSQIDLFARAETMADYLEGKGTPSADAASSAQTDRSDSASKGPEGSGPR